MDFVNEGKLEEEIKRRQAEWERVRKKDDPVGKRKSFIFVFISKLFTIPNRSKVSFLLFFSRESLNDR